MEQFNKWYKECDYSGDTLGEMAELTWRAALGWVRDNVCEEAWTDDDIENAIDYELESK